MPLNLTVFDNECAAIIADLPNKMIWQGNTYDVAVNSFAQGHALQQEGYVPELDFGCLLRIADFADVAMPKQGDVVTIDGRKARVLSFNDAPDNVSRTLICVNVQR